MLDGVRYGPIVAALDSRKGDNAWLTVSLKEGKNREIRKVMAGLNLHVSRLIRTSYGPFPLGTLQKGELEEIPPRVLRDQLPKAPEKTATPHNAPRNAARSKTR